MPGSVTVKLNDGTSVPVLACGTAIRKKVSDSDRKAMTRVRMDACLEAGMCNIDCAEIYGNQEEVGRGLKELLHKMRREDIFVTTKCWKHGPRESLEKSLESLGLEFVDMYLIHRPECCRDHFHMGLGEAWSEMETQLSEGKVRSIGVSNYGLHELKETMETAKVVPSVNQIEVHPYVMTKARRRLIEYCKEKSITIASYGATASLSAFRGGSVDTVVNSIAESLGAIADQVLLKWAHQVTNGGVVLTASSRAERLKGQTKAFDELRSLSKMEVQSITQAGSRQKNYSSLYTSSLHTGDNITVSTTGPSS